MDYANPTLLIISGPNGAGKSTHIQRMLPLAFKGVWSFDRDKTRTAFIDQLINEGEAQKNLLVKATRLMEDKLVMEMKLAIFSKQHFVLETPLSHPDYWAYIDLFENTGYQIQLNYLGLDKVHDCISRVGQRVSEGGHYVDPTTIKGVYEKNLEYIDACRQTFQIIELYDGMTSPTLIVKIQDDRVIYAEKHSIKKPWIKSGLPSISVDIKLFLNNR